MSQGCEFEASLNELMKKAFNYLFGGFRESIYQNAIAFEMRNLNWDVAKEVRIPVLYENKK